MCFGSCNKKRRITPYCLFLPTHNLVRNVSSGGEGVELAREEESSAAQFPFVNPAFVDMTQDWAVSSSQE